MGSARPADLNTFRLFVYVGWPVGVVSRTSALEVAEAMTGVQQCLTVAADDHIRVSLFGLFLLMPL